MYFKNVKVAFILVKVYVKTSGTKIELANIYGEQLGFSVTRQLYTLALYKLSDMQLVGKKNHKIMTLTKLYLSFHSWKISVVRMNC